MGCHSLPHEIFPTQRSNLDLLNCRQILHCPSHRRVLGAYRTVTFSVSMSFLPGGAFRNHQCLVTYSEIHISLKCIPFLPLKFLLHRAEGRFGEVQCGTEKGKKPFLHTRAAMNADHLCPSWSAGNGLALEPHHIYRSKHKWLLPDCFMIH